ncbi:MAG: Uma2 family endonuclease, partial [Myxococcota bacterium]
MIAVPQLESKPDDEFDNVVIFSGASWWQFETLLAVRGDAPVPRMAYLDGQVELMSPSRVHEATKGALGRLIEAYADIRDVEVESRGSETLRLATEECGAEPDECYNVGEDTEFPRLVIEVVRSSRGLDKFRIFAAFGIEEFWRWVNGELTLCRLEDERRYVAVEESQVLPGLTQALLAEALSTGTQTQAVRHLRAVLDR